VLLAFLIFGVWQDSIAGLIVGILVMDLAVQSSQVANQTRVYALDPNARSRLNTVFMATMLAGGAAGAGIGGIAYASWGWTGTCSFGAIAASLALLLARKS